MKARFETKAQIVLQEIWAFLSAGGRSIVRPLIGIFTIIILLAFCYSLIGQYDIYPLSMAMWIIAFLLVYVLTIVSFQNCKSFKWFFYSFVGFYLGIWLFLFSATQSTIQPIKLAFYDVLPFFQILDKQDYHYSIKSVFYDEKSQRILDEEKDDRSRKQRAYLQKQHDIRFGIYPVLKIFAQIISLLCLVFLGIALNNQQK